MSNNFQQGQRVRSLKPGGGKGTIKELELDTRAIHITGSQVTYTVQWDDGDTESLISPVELAAIPNEN